METVRDVLALERTRLANERTFLAYVRTALSLVAAAAVLFEFFSEIQAYFAVAWVLAVAGTAVFLIGILRFRSVNARLQARPIGEAGERP